MDPGSHRICSLARLDLWWMSLSRHPSVKKTKQMEWLFGDTRDCEGKLGIYNCGGFCTFCTYCSYCMSLTDCGCVNGVCDNRPGSGGVCQSWSCKEGYTGKFCDRTSKNCGLSELSQYCHQHAVCSLNDTARSVSGTFRAHCTGTGLLPLWLCVCVCALGAQDCLSNWANLLVINLPCLRGCSTCVPFVFILLRCICKDGYEGDGFSCQPIDLCIQPERGGCSQNVSGVRLWNVERQILSVRVGIQDSWDCYRFYVLIFPVCQMRCSNKCLGIVVVKMSIIWVGAKMWHFKDNLASSYQIFYKPHRLVVQIIFGLQWYSPQALVTCYFLCSLTVRSNSYSQ